MHGLFFHRVLSAVEAETLRQANPPSEHCYATSYVACWFQ